MKYDLILPSPITPLGLNFSDNVLTRITFLNKKLTPSKQKIPSNFETVVTELKKYFAGKSKKFNIDLILSGTEFQKRVYRALLKIPYGQVLTYGQLAKQLDTAPRAIGAACRNNPIPIIVPCHRIVAAQGIGGYAGDGLDSKNHKYHLLKLEGVVE